MQLFLSMRLGKRVYVDCVDGGGKIKLVFTTTFSGACEVRLILTKVRGRLGPRDPDIVGGRTYLRSTLVVTTTEIDLIFLDPPLFPLGLRGR